MHSIISSLSPGDIAFTIFFYSVQPPCARPAYSPFALKMSTRTLFQCSAPHSCVSRQLKNVSPPTQKEIYKTIKASVVPFWNFDLDFYMSLAIPETLSIVRFHAFTTKNATTSLFTPHNRFIRTQYA